MDENRGITGAETGAAIAAKENVELLIKASNQQYDDQIVISDLKWTVKRLKTQLSLVYPSKPAVADQKLIYSGKLLDDALQLKDVIRSYNHIFHLVCTQTNPPPTSSIQKPKMSTISNVNTNSNLNNNDGIRQRHVNPAPAAVNVEQQSQQQSGQANMQQPQYQQQQQQPQQQGQQFLPLSMMVSAMMAAQQVQQAQMAACSPNTDPNSANDQVPYNFQMAHALGTQNAAMYNWINQMYYQYRDQYMRMSNAAAANLVGNPVLQNMPFMMPNTGATAGAVGPSILNPVIQFQNAAMQQSPIVAQPQLLRAANAFPHGPQIIPNVVQDNINIPQSEQQQQQQVPPQQEPQPQVQPRFPNIAPQPDEQENRDWLDSFFAITRLCLFMTILYFNGSLFRCVLVVLIASLIYLYHIGIGFVRNERNNNEVNRVNRMDNRLRGILIRRRHRDRGVRGQRAAQPQPAQPAQPVQPGDQQQPQEQQQQQQQGEERLIQRNQQNAGGAGANSDSDGDSDGDPATDATLSNDQNDAANNSNSVISFIRTFVVTFFTSLLPET